MTYDKVTFGRTVAARRKALKLAQTSVPNGPSSSYMSDIENAKMDPISSETLDKLAKGLVWDRDLLGRVYTGQAPVDSLPVEAAVSPPRIEETYYDRVLREATEAQEVFEKLADDLVAAEAALDRASALAFRVILVMDRMTETGEDARTADRSVTATDVAEAMTAHATIDGHEWTRYEIALIERFDPGYVAAVDELTTYQRYMDMTSARKRASRIPLPESGTVTGGGNDGTQTPTQKNELEERRTLNEQEVSEGDATMLGAADDVTPGVDEGLGESDQRE